jgi:hypothetical protein
VISGIKNIIRRPSKFLILLLRFVAELIEVEFLGDDEEENYAMAIRNAADFFERSASAWPQ